MSLKSDLVTISSQNVLSLSRAIVWMRELLLGEQFFDNLSRSRTHAESSEMLYDMISRWC